MTMALQPVDWNETVAAHLALAAATGDPERTGYTVGFYEAEYRAGRLALVAGLVGGVHVATAAYRFEAVAGGLELFIVASGGAGDGCRLTAAFWPALEAMAAAAGARSVRFNTRRDGLVSLAERRGYARAETIMRKALA